MTRDVITDDEPLAGATGPVFAEPVHVNGRVYIPTSTVDHYGAIGTRGGRTIGEGRPVAIIEAAADGIVVRPVLDLPKIGLALVGAVLTVWGASRLR